MIQKYQYGNPLLQSDHKRRGKINTWINQGVKQVGMQARQAENNIRQFHKADARANRKTKVPMKSNNLAKLQEDLWNIGAFKGIKDRHGKEVTYNTAVDGIEGNMTRIAIANAQKMGYIVNSNGMLQQSKQQVKPQQTKPQARRNGLAEMYGMTHAAATGGMSQTVESQKSRGRSVENVFDFISHNPGLILLEDIDRANFNRLTEKLFGIRPFKGRTITSLPSMQMEELKKQVQFAKSKGKNWFDSEMYQQMYGHNYASKNGTNGEDRSGFWNRIRTPKGRLEHTLGAYGFYTDEQGNTIVHDIYDFNVGQKQGGDGRYAATRNFVGQFASRSTDPNEGKNKYNINLGKL